MLMLERAGRTAGLMVTKWGGKAGFIIMVVVVVGTGSRSLATTASNRSWTVPRDTLVAMTLVYSGDGFGFVGAEELKRGT